MEIIHWLPISIFLVSAEGRNTDFKVGLWVAKSKHEKKKKSEITRYTVSLQSGMKFNLNCNYQVFVWFESFFFLYIFTLFKHCHTSNQAESILLERFFFTVQHPQPKHIWYNTFKRVPTGYYFIIYSYFKGRCNRKSKKE